MSQPLVRSVQPTDTLSYALMPIFGGGLPLGTAFNIFIVIGFYSYILIWKNFVFSIFCGAIPTLIISWWLGKMRPGYLGQSISLFLGRKSHSRFIGSLCSKIERSLNSGWKTLPSPTGKGGHFER